MKLDLFSTGPTAPESNLKKSPNPQTDVSDLLFDPDPLAQQPTQVQPTTTGIRPTGIGNLMLAQQQQPTQFHQHPVMQAQTDILMTNPNLTLAGPMLPGPLVGVGPALSGNPAAVNTMLPGNPAALHTLLLGHQASVGLTMPGYPATSGGPTLLGNQTAFEPTLVGSQTVDRPTLLGNQATGGSMLQPGSPGVAGSAGIMVPTKTPGKETPPPASTTSLKATDSATLAVSLIDSI